jgi:hypothetical protein
MVMRVKLKNQGQKKEKSKPAASAKPSGAQKTRLKPKAAAPSVAAVQRCHRKVMALFEGESQGRLHGL